MLFCEFYEVSMNVKASKNLQDSFFIRAEKPISFLKKIDNKKNTNEAEPHLCFLKRNLIRVISLFFW